MLENIIHIGLTVSDLDRSVAFYKDVLGLNFVGEITMEGEETNTLFDMVDGSCRIAYLNGSDDVMAPPVELIQFTNYEVEKRGSDLKATGINEICFKVKDIDAVYKHLLENNVECISAPQPFDFTKDGFGKSKAIYLKDPDGIILELMQAL